MKQKVKKKNLQDYQFDINGHSPKRNFFYSFIEKEDVMPLKSVNMANRKENACSFIT